MSAPAKPKEAAPPKDAPAAVAPAASGKLMLVVVILCSANVGATGFVITRVLKQPKIEARAESPKRRAVVAEKKEGDEESGADGGKADKGDGGKGSDGDEGGGEKAEGGDKKAPGPSVALEPFLVNLNEPGSGRYLKASIEVEVNDKGTVEELNTQKRSIRDDLLRYLSSLSVADTLGETGKDKIKLAMASRIGKQIGGKDKVHGLFFTEFMVQ